MQSASTQVAVTTLLALSLAACGGPGAGDASPIPSTGVPVAAVDARGVEPPPADPTIVGASPTLPPRMAHPKVPPPTPVAPPLPAAPPDPFAPPISPPPTPPRPTSTGVPL